MRRHFLFLLCVLALSAPMLAGEVVRHPFAGIDDQYIVMLADSTPPALMHATASRLAGQHGAALVAVYGNVRAFLVRGPAPAMAALAKLPNVVLVEQDMRLRGPSDAASTSPALTAASTESSATEKRLGARSLRVANTAATTRWYLDRLDNYTGTNGDYNMCPTGSTTTAYVMDYAVWKHHRAFTDVNGNNSRVTTTVDCTAVGGCVEVDAAENCRNHPDINRRVAFLQQTHGTGVASLLSGEVPGSPTTSTGAARAEIVSVSVYPCQNNAETQSSWIIAALNWIKGHAQGRKNVGAYLPSIINHSGYVYPWDNQSGAVMNAVRDVVGAHSMPYFTSADNFGGDACAFTPNNYAYTRYNRHWTRVVFTVGASGTADESWVNPSWNAQVQTQGVREKGTNLGDCVSAFAPGVNIVAAGHGSGSANVNHYETKGNGTSWSSPLAGAVALRWLQAERAANRTRNHYEVYAFLIDNGVTMGNVTTNQAYTLCYNPNDLFDWYYNGSGQVECDSIVHQEAYMPAATNSSDARMIYWQGTTCQ
jgi:hypothetical protein